MTAPALDKSGRAIRDMFAGVAPRYDLLNHLLSGALDTVWRRRAARALGLGEGARVLDLCAGTGDQAVAVRRRGPWVAAADFCLPMLALARRKFARRGGGMQPLSADALALPLADSSVGGATVSFGLRNVADLDGALREIRRVLVPGGRLVVLECAIPEHQPVRGAYLLYFLRVLPRIGRLLSPRGSAYTYLPASVLDFPQRRAFCAAMRAAGFVDCTWEDLTLGTVCMYAGDTPGDGR